VLPLPVARISFVLRRENGVHRFARFGCAAASTLLVTRGQEHLQRRVRADHRADVSTLGDIPPSVDQLALASDHRLAHARMD
jgi:hypothetical protein